MEHLGRYQVTVEIHQEGNQWVSRCEELDVASCGDTFEEALANLYDALELYMETLDAAGEVEHLLAMKELHSVPITADQPAPKAPVFRATLPVPVSR